MNACFVSLCSAAPYHCVCICIFHYYIWQLLCLQYPFALLLFFLLSDTDTHGWELAILNLTPQVSMCSQSSPPTSRIQTRRWTTVSAPLLLIVFILSDLLKRLLSGQTGKSVARHYWASPSSQTCGLGHLWALVYNRKCVCKTLQVLNNAKAQCPWHTLNPHTFTCVVCFRGTTYPATLLIQSCSVVSFLKEKKSLF